MEYKDSFQTIQVSFPKANDSTLIQQLSDENFRLRQIIDEVANKLAMQQELTQQLRDEIATLKGQKPKPKIPPSKLGGPNSRPDWRKRISPQDHQMKNIVFSSWVNDSVNFNISSMRHCFSVT